MKILVINGSPKAGNSDTLKVTKAFLQGMGETGEIIHTSKVNVKPCLGCLACWLKTRGVCVQKDDMTAILEKYKAADLVIWSTPLYFFSIPSNCKAVMDRLLPLDTIAMVVDDNGRTEHVGRVKLQTKHLLIAGCGFPDREGNFDGLIFMFQRGFGNIPMILCREAPLLGDEPRRDVADKYLSFATKAGAEYKATGTISATTQAALDAPMMPPDKYRQGANKEDRASR
jgi:putative NADPH-quinone reductase